ncbi:putative ABC transporter C family member 15 isoform X2 [Eutrema salsugineum]|uniref:putative ABC transporter C family member 15 isoform X2 n=1 Tax=Eutrema salsugineum TaxID=72664 RepID=UPI000CED10CF|nr:putative ABC transporter C family member 15 isoform X2 [Eutrema salsugineum]
MSRPFGSAEMGYLLLRTQWLQLNSVCLKERISISMQVAFFAFFVIHFTLIWLGVVRNRGDHAVEDLKKQSITVKQSFSYSLSLVCSVSIFGAHCVILLSLFRDSVVSRCDSSVSVFSAEISQAFSWLIISVYVVKIRKRSLVKFSWMLRLWWLCSFILSFAFDAQFITAKHEPLGFQDYCDLTGVIASLFLLAVSIRGKTGFPLLESSEITEPLLLGGETEHSKKDSPSSSSSPYGNATLFQRITFSWINPLFSLGYKRPLEKDDVPDIDVKDSAQFCSQAFDKKLKTTIEEEGLGKAFFYKSVLRFVWKKAAINAVFAVVNASTAYIGPYLINDFVVFLTEKQDQSLKYGYFLALGFLSAKIVETVTQRQWIFGARQLGLRLRAALISHIYQKGLVLSSQSRQSHTSGEIINYMSVDVQRITDFIWYVNTIWMLPIQIFSAIFILQKHLGLGALAALVTTLMVMACNYPLTRIQRNYQSDIMNAKDDRMKATSEILKNMKILKLQAWDNQFLNKVKRLRKKEYDCLRKSLRLQAFTTFILWGAPALISVVTFVTCMLIGVKLTAGAVLSALATFQMLQSPIFGLPDLLSALVQSKVSADRIASYLQQSETQKDAVEYNSSKDHAAFSVEIENGAFSWEPEASRPTLDGIELRVKRGMKVAICGAVGSGKSSLLSCILGEIQKLKGAVRVSGKQAYVPQSPWILTGTIRDNILFGSIYESEKYERTVKACALIKDFELFSNGDMTEIGERGINMSGGQKQRIQIARAVYQDADIYLLDDPFSAVDAHTGRQLFEECLMGILKEKTVLYVTHQVEFLPAADLILVMQKGRVMQAGRFEELLKQNIGFEVLVGAHNEALESILSIEKSSRNFKDESKDETASIAESLQAQCDSEHNISTENKKKEAKLVQDEETEKGVIGKEVYLAYLRTVKGGLLVPLIILAQSCFQMLQIASNYWMAWTAPPSSESKPKFGMDRILLVYALLAAGSSLCVLARTILVAIGGLLTAEKFFSRMLCSIFRAPMSFFDSTPTGRILNRASTDQSVLDLEMATKLGWCAFSIIQIVGTIFVMSQVAWQVCVIFIPVAVACVFYQRYYTPTARELSRMSGVERAPILHHFAESLAGATTIRAFDQRDRFISSNLSLIDNHSKPWFHVASAMEWLSFRLNLLSHFVFAFSLVLLVTLPEGVINPSIAGLGVTYGLSLNVLQATVIWNICNAENKMISVERILQYSKIPSEAPLVIDDNKPLDNWPNVGSIVFRNLQVRYAEHFPAVLKNITCEFPGGKKIGVVGRTGSGKSTLIQAIFRIVEPSQGTIVIDDVDITKIGLHDLRSRLGIIPQDPALFDGTVRVNLDPLSQHTDREIWEALDKCQLGEVIRGKDEKLDATVVENGENWSVGQRQLVCLGRVLLKKSNILVLDEATASVDSATDGVIQKIISQEFKDRTVVTIAHRIHTVIESDLVLVLSDGRIAEFDSPAKLLERDDSFFSKLIKEYSMRSKHFTSSNNLLT